MVAPCGQHVRSRRGRSDAAHTHAMCLIDEHAGAQVVTASASAHIPALEFAIISAGVQQVWRVSVEMHAPELVLVRASAERAEDQRRRVATD